MFDTYDETYLTQLRQQHDQAAMSVVGFIQNNTADELVLYMKNLVEETKSPDPAIVLKACLALYGLQTGMIQDMEMKGADHD
jgi:hypothetical protein|tara:strand:- start:148 stop:393 length:246 start_codon:yes stop_codon:yes gene_type:complete